MICCTRSLGDWSWTGGAGVFDCSDGDGIAGDETGGDGIAGDETGGALDTSKDRGTRPTRSRSKRAS